MDDTACQLCGTAGIEQACRPGRDRNCDEGGGTGSPMRPTDVFADAPPELGAPPLLARSSSAIDFAGGSERTVLRAC